MGQRRLRILALHGYHGSGAVLRGQLQPLAEGLEPLADFICVDAPSLAAGDFGWWHAVPDDAATPAGAGARRMHYRGWSQTRQWFASLCAHEGPFDGVFGFSQGAALAALVVGLCALEGGRGFDFAIMAGGFMSDDVRHAPLYDALGAGALPSLHLVGRGDGVVPAARSRALAERFADPLILEHAGGHIIPSTPPIRRATLEFLERMSRRHAGRAGVTATAQTERRPPPGTQPLEVPLWPGRAHPSLRLFFPDGDRARPRPALLVLRGGAYFRSDGSGAGTAEWAAQHGLVGIEVEYRTRSTHDAYPANYADAARAVRLVRQRATEWGIDPRRVGVVGYSAGGHLASLLSTQPDLLAVPADDLAPRVSARPDLLVLAYPLVSFVEQFTPGAFVGSVESFFGRSDVSLELRRAFSSELHVEATHPPVFVWTTADDALVPYTHAQLFAEACRRAHVPVTFKLFAHGPHGLGLALDRPGEVGAWTTLLLEWLTRQWGPL